MAARTTPPRPTDAELEILSVLWDLGPSTVREIQETLVKRKPTQYTTVLKLLQIMTGKGLVLRDESARAHKYRASRAREWTQRQLVGTLLSQAFEGSAKGLMIGALSARKVSKQELTDIRRVLDDYEKDER